MTETVDESPRLKPVRFVGSSRKDIRKLPEGVKSVFGKALYDAQTGKKHPGAKPLKGFGGAGVLEVVEDDEGGTYRAVYTVKFAEVVYVLHVFQKKSNTGIKTPTYEIDTIKTRFKAAEVDYEEFRQKSQNGDEETKLS
ncbi:MAG: type II toxin-antitoxin system RelE/ParE family toxin [Fimbriiglobus sp.]